MSEQVAVTLLFPDSHRTELALSQIGEHATGRQLMEYIYQTYNETSDGNEDSTRVWGDGFVPKTWEQVRLIHLGGVVPPECVLSGLKWEISEVLHVSCKPIADGKKKKSRMPSIVSRHSLPVERTGSATTADGNSGGSCCVIC